MVCLRRLVKIFLIGLLLPGYIIYVNSGMISVAGEKYPVEGVLQVVRGAVQDTCWMNLHSREQLYEHFSQYYAADLLEDITEKTWQFVQTPTDLYTRAEVTSFSSVTMRQNGAMVTAAVELLDLDTGSTEQGRGVFYLKMTAAGWRIIRMEFIWHTMV